MVIQALTNSESNKKGNNMKALNWLVKLAALFLIGAALWKIVNLSPWASIPTIVVHYTILFFNSVILYTLHFEGRRGAPKTALILSVIQTIGLFVIASMLFDKGKGSIAFIPLALGIVGVITIRISTYNIGRLKARTITSNISSNAQAKVYKKIWHLPEENSWKSFNLMAMKDVGDLMITDSNINFIGTDNNIEIANIQNITYGKQGRDFVNNWVKVEYDNGKTAFFADGRWLGWKGILGGTKKIQQSLQHCCSRQEMA